MGTSNHLLIGQYGALKLTFSLLKRVLFLVLSSSFSPLSSNIKFPLYLPLSSSSSSSSSPQDTTDTRTRQLCRLKGNSTVHWYTSTDVS